MTISSHTTPQPLEPQQEQAKAVILAARQELQSAGIRFVAMHFDGAGDEGVNEAVKGYDSESYENAWAGIDFLDYATDTKTDGGGIVNSKIHNNGVHPVSINCNLKVDWVRKFRGTMNNRKAIGKRRTRATAFPQT